MTVGGEVQGPGYPGDGLMGLGLQTGFLSNLGGTDYCPDLGGISEAILLKTDLYKKCHLCPINTKGSNSHFGLISAVKVSAVSSRVACSI